MTNKEIARNFNELARIMELHDENPFKIRSYANAYLQLRKVGTPLVDMSDAEISGIKGVGKAIAGKIRELERTGTLAALEKYREMTPQGVQDMLRIKGFGPKKIKSLWKGLEVETIGELLYACNENRLVELKGFGAKTQEDLRKKLEYFLKSQDQFLYATLEEVGEEVLAHLQQALPAGTPVAFVGAFRRRNPVLKGIELLVGGDLSAVFDGEELRLVRQEEDYYLARTADEIPVRLFQCRPEAFGSKLFRHTGTEAFTQYFLERAQETDFRDLAEEAEVFAKAGIPYIEPELREGPGAVDRALVGDRKPLIEVEEVRGVLHAHSTYSDGINSLREMAEYSRDRGYEYLGITDHSKSAFYANGLKEDRLRRQWAEIDVLNEELAPFKIYKGIESDILNDGSLDYPADLLQEFDFIIASVHSNLRMDQTKATKRLLAAIANPYTTMLGHPTGRLLLAREGYPIDHRAVIDACAEFRVAIELNANPLRLDLDHTWIEYALEKGVLLSVNPDAHSTGGIHDIHYGVLAARKGGLSADRCVCCFDRTDFEAFLAGQRV
ncbi:MAG: PHP domain-containing protein [Bacteroidota bacterium]